MTIYFGRSHRKTSEIPLRMFFRKSRTDPLLLETITSTGLSPRRHRECVVQTYCQGQEPRRVEGKG